MRIEVAQFHQRAAALVLQGDKALLRELVGKITEAADAVIAFGERRVELQQRALEQSELRRDLAVGQHFQRALDQRHGLFDGCVLP